MPVKAPTAPISISKALARRLWIAAQRLNSDAPFGSGATAVHAAITQLGYVQIDTINVIERCHHHILYNRIPTYRLADLAAAQSDDKSVFEYWTHALAYLPVEAFPHFVGAMKAHAREPQGWGGQTSPYMLRKVINRIRDEGPLSVADFKDERLIDKAHLWASKKPSKFALESGFYSGKLVVSRRRGMEKFYDLTGRHFDWEKLPPKSTTTQILNYELDRALTAQAMVSLNSICHLAASRKPAMLALIEKRLKRRQLVELTLSEDPTTRYFARPETIHEPVEIDPERTHILSPFDPLIIQRDRTRLLFDYAHLFEAYLPEAKRKWGYFTLPVMIGEQIVAGLDIKTDRQNQSLTIRNWHWFDDADPTRHKPLIEAALGPFEDFQLNR